MASSLRRPRNAPPARRGSDEDDAPRTSFARSPSPLSPPRPSFHGAARERSSWNTDTSADPATSDSDREGGVGSTTLLTTGKAPQPRAHAKRRSVGSAKGAYTPVDSPFFAATDSMRVASQVPSLPVQDFTPDAQTSMTASPRSSRAPPSAYQFPFQAYSGNPDPGTAIPGLKSRRTSLESLRDRRPGTPQHGLGVYDAATPQTLSVYSALNGSDAEPDLAAPTAPFMRRAPTSAAGSTTSFRPGFQSPASRPSSLWSPPTSYAPTGTDPPPPLPKGRPPLPSTLLPAPLPRDAKPWLVDKDRGGAHGWTSWWVTVCVFFLGVGGAAVLCWRGYVSAGAQLIPAGQLCSVLDEGFDGDLDSSKWTRDVQLGGFGNGEFQMTTASDKNAFTRNGELYILPTFTSDEIGLGAVTDGGNYTLSGCTSSNHTACTASSSQKLSTVINPVQSARLSTRNSTSIKYGRVDVKAKLPRGDWLWPAIWMLPVDDAYGPWPLSGEIDIMEARGNAPSYPAQGLNTARSTLTWGPLAALLTHTFGWQTRKRTDFAAGFHTYTLEWTEDFVRMYVDSRLDSMVQLGIGARDKNGKGEFWNRGKWPATAVNGTGGEVVVVQDPWDGDGAGKSAPFDQEFYLILDLAVGGTSGWFPDNVGGKMWYDGSATAMRDFAKAQETWSATWPEDEDERAFRIDSVKMWKLC